MNGASFARALRASFALALVAAAAGAQPFLLATSPGTGAVVALRVAGGGTVRTFAAGTTPAGAALSADQTRLYVADAGAGELRVIDPAVGAIDSVAVGAGPAGVALCTGGARLAVALAQDDAVAVVDTATLGVVATLPAGDQPLAVACAAGFLAVANYGSATISVFDAATLAPLGTAPVGGFPAGVAIGGDRAWVTSLFDSNVTVVALPGVTVDDTVTVGSAPRGIAFSGGRVFVANVNDSTVTVLDSLTALVVATIPLPTPGPTDLLVRGDVFVAHLGEPAVTQISTAALAVTATLDAPTGLLALGGVTELAIAPTEIPALGPIGRVILAAALGLLASLALRRRGGLALALFVALAGAAAAQAQSVTYTDSTFANGDWELFTGADPGQNATQSAFAGNPPPSRAMVHLHLPGESILVVHRWLASSHDPATAGAVTGIDVAWDRRAGGLDCPPPEAVTEAFVVFQAGVDYSADPEVFSNSEWTTAGTTGLVAADFDDGSGGSPDFSAAGEALTFGYLRSTTTTVEDPPHVICHGIDNLAVTVATAEPEPPGESLVGLDPTDYFTLDGDDLVVSATRTGDLTGEASAQVILSIPLGVGPDRTLTWPAGTGGEATATFPAAGLGAGLNVRSLRLVNATGAVIDPQRDAGMAYVGNSPLDALWAAFSLLLAGWDLAAVVLLAAAAGYALVRRRQLPARRSRRMWLALAALAASSGCVQEEGVVVAYDSTRFNERISSDLQALSPLERATDLQFGVFRDGSIDPDGPAGPRGGGLVSEIFPVVAAGSAGVGHLIQAPCLFVGKNGRGADQLRVNWEVVASLDRSKNEYLEQALLEGYDEVGLCTLSSPETRVLFEDPNAPYPPADAFAATGCNPRGDGSIALTATVDPDELQRNIPLPCRVGGYLVTRLEFLALQSEPSDNPDAVCPVGELAGGKSPVLEYGCMRSGSLLPACGLPCGLEPTEDARYSVRVDSTASPSLPEAQRWLRPDVLVVNDARTLTRPMTASSSLSYAWATDVKAPGGAEGPVRWAENYSPTVRVETVQIIGRHAQGGELVVTPAENRLTVEIPRFGQIAPTLLHCLGDMTPAGFAFSLADCAARSDEPGVLAALTPTYLVENLHLGEVKQPITWRVTLAEEQNNSELFIRFGTRAQTMGAALRVSSALDFGRIPDTEYRQGSVEVENVGGEAVEVTSIDFVPTIGHPQDFSFFVVGDPVPMPLPIDAKPLDGGGVSLGLGDLGEAPLLAVSERGGAVEVRLGDPAAPPGDVQAFTLYGEGATLRGGVLTRDDPGAAFTPPAASGPRPFVVPAFAEESAPFTLAPGERRQIVVETRPTAHGLRSAELRLRYTDATSSQAAQVRSQLRVEVVSGPLLRHAPISLYVYRDANGNQPGHRTAILFNAGHFDLTVHGIQTTGAAASRFVASSDRGLGPLLLSPGDFVDLRIEYLPECDGTYGTPTSALDHEATLVVNSDGGTARIALGGASQGFCAAP